MPQTISVDNVSLLQAALEGLEMQKKRIEDQISEVRSMLRQKATGPAVAPAAVPAPKKVRRRKLSSAARKRIAEAQKKRWAKFREKNPAKK